MVQESPFCGKASEDANAHLQNFLKVSSIINSKALRWIIFVFDCSHSLCLEKQRRGSTPTRTHSTLGMCAPNTFLVKYFPVDKTNALWNMISSFQQLQDEKVSKAWERLQEYTAACSHHGIVAEPPNLSWLKSVWSPFYKDNPANAPETEQIR